MSRGKGFVFMENYIGRRGLQRFGGALMGSLWGGGR